MEKIAYLILAHNDQNQLYRLINKINFNADFYIHLDGKANIDAFNERLSDMPNVHFISKRYPVFWGGFNMIEATKALLQEAVLAPVNYKRLILLSGADYPLKTNEEIHSFFEKNENVEYIKAFNVTQSHSKHYLKHIKNLHIILNYSYYPKL